MKWVTVLGATGSIGVNTLDVISLHPDRYSVFALTAHKNIELLYQQCQAYKPRYAVVSQEQDAMQLRKLLSVSADTASTEVLYGKQGLQDVAAAAEVDVVMAAIVGAAGLTPTMAAVKSGKRVLLANKESLVMAGSLFMSEVAASGAELLPIDSEHNAIYQCLPAEWNQQSGVRKILLTGSGGPFRTWSQAEIWSATPEQACKHPNWSMGRKISVDSATLMNKGLEFIEAKWLFSVQPSDIEVVIHPQSLIHSMVEYVDGSILAQMGSPDMRTPIAHGLAYPERVESGVCSLDIIAAARMDFEAPDVERFPALSLAIEAAKSGIGAATVLNAANEIVVAEFLKGSFLFGRINELLLEIMDQAQWSEPFSLDDVEELDVYSRRLANECIYKGVLNS